MIAASGGCTAAWSSASSPSRGGDHLEAGVAEDDPERAEDLRLVVADEHPRAVHRRRASAARRRRLPPAAPRRGNSTTNAVPWPGSDSALIVPPLAVDEAAGDREAEAGAAAADERAGPPR